MNIKIDKKTTIQDFNDRFTTLFPYLKVQFFQKGHKKFSPSHSKFMFADQQVKISDVIDFDKSFEINVKPDLKTFEFEDMMEKKYNLHVQVMRKSGSTFLMTSQTDEWTLEEQNNIGFESVHYKHEDEEDKIDYREMD